MVVEFGVLDYDKYKGLKPLFFPEMVKGFIANISDNLVSMNHCSQVFTLLNK